jgi:response regulator RpfG family c-di-GMP phosphodiesterase
VLDTTEFPVVISDMVMDEMNGIEFILAAREKSPSSVYMLLTALRDRETGVKALNDCTTAELVNFIDAAYAAYRRKVTQS